jgi:hypothetical protein
MKMFSLFKRRIPDDAIINPDMIRWQSPKIQLEIFHHVLDANGCRHMQQYIERFPETYGAIANTQVINKGNQAYVYVWYLPNKKW